MGNNDFAIFAHLSGIKIKYIAFVEKLFGDQFFLLLYDLDFHPRCKEGTSCTWSHLVLAGLSLCFLAHGHSLPNAFT